MSNFPFDNASISHSKACRSSKRVGSNTDIALNSESSPEGFPKLLTEIGDGWLEITMPIVTVSEANGGAKKAYKRNGKVCYKSEHWSEKSTRHRRQKGKVALHLRPHRHLLSMPCHITLTRFAPRKLDRFDNLPMSLKYILDSICEIITNDYTPGRADSHEGLIVNYDQVFSKEYGIKIRIVNL